MRYVTYVDHKSNSLEVTTLYKENVIFVADWEDGNDTEVELSINQVKDLIEQLSAWVGMQEAK